MKAVLHSSACLAYLFGEEGTSTVAEVLDGGALLSSVNLAEILSKLADLGKARSKGLSLGDRSCLALAAAVAVPAYTADSAWRGVEAGVEIRFVR